ncbi:MAG: hypothetical protein JOZ19_07910 [Rubrobacter sp.]|nr:hypothetical protein [Rubrobacter sp.]
MSTNVTQWGALGAILAGVVWLASGLVDMTFLRGQDYEAPGFIFLVEAMYIVALAGTLGGLVGLHTRQATRYGWLGKAGFLAAFIGSALLLIGLVLTFLIRDSTLERVFADPVLGLGLLCTFIGFVLLGVATLMLGVLPQWCGLLLIVCLPLAVILGDYGGGIALGLAWLALGYVLLSQRDVSALVGGSEKR